MIVSSPSHSLQKGTLEIPGGCTTAYWCTENGAKADERHDAATMFFNHSPHRLSVMNDLDLPPQPKAESGNDDEEYPQRKGKTDSAVLVSVHRMPTVRMASCSVWINS